MQKILSKTREGARAYSRRAGITELSQDNLPLAQIGGTMKIGSPTVDQLQLGIDFPNAQSAIEDLVHLYQTPINGVVIYTDSTKTPAGASMIERLVVSGESTSTVTYVYGIPVPVTVGENQDSVTAKILAVLNKYKTAGIAIRDVKLVSGSNSQLDVTFNDTNPHENYRYSNNGITIQGSTQSAAVPGYGTWSKIGEQDVSFTGVSTTKLYYYKRVA